MLLARPSPPPPSAPRPLREALAGPRRPDRRRRAPAFAAIRLANPGGLGAADHDVARTPAVTLREAMARPPGATASPAPTSPPCDVFDLGLPALSAPARAGRPASAVYLAFLSALPDTHVARKHGRRARGREAAALEARLRHATKPPGGARSSPSTPPEGRGINPGTSADLTVATLFVRMLGAPSLHKPGVGACWRQRPRLPTPSGQPVRLRRTLTTGIVVRAPARAASGSAWWRHQIISRDREEDGWRRSTR